MLNHLWRSVLMAGVVLCLVAPPAVAEETGNEAKGENAKSHAPLIKGGWGDRQLAQSPIQVTGVSLNPTETGIEVILETPQGKALQPRAIALGKSYIANIPDAVLALPQRQEFRQDNPASGITRVSVTQTAGNNIRVTVTGATGLPAIQLYDSPTEGLIFGVASAASTPQGQKPQAPSGETDKPVVGEDEEKEIVVTGEQETGYNVPNTSTATRTNTPLREIPQSIQVIPQEVLRDQRADLTSALLNAPSVRNSAPTNFDSLRLQVRGFFTPVTVNGFKDSLNSSTIGSDLTGYDRIEVLLGPNSILFGSSAPGGTVNLVTKQPLRDPYYFVEATIGNFDFYRGEVDLSGPLDESKNVLYRLNASYRDQGLFTDLTNITSFVVAPAISFAFTENTKLTLEGRYADVKFDSITFGLPLIGTIRSNPNGEIPRDRNVNEGTLDAESSRIGYTLEHKFNQNWSLRNAFQYTRYFSAYFGDDGKGGTFPTALLPDNRTLERIYLNERSEQSDYRLSTDVIGNFATGSIQHQLLFGLDLGRVTGEFSGQNREIALLDLFDPIYGQPPGAVIPGSEYDNKNETEELGLIVQDRVTITDNLKLLLGGRFDIFEQTDTDSIADTETNQSGDAFSPRLGILYQPIPPISLYANYSRSFEPSIGQSFDGSEFEPTRGTQFEIGVKADLNDRLSTTLAWYNISQSNVTTEDPDNIGFEVQTGEQRSRGIELNLAGEILPGWNIFASYAYNDAEVTEDNVIPVGNRVELSTPHAASLWTTYEIQQGDLQGLGFGLGLFYVGDRAGDRENTFEVPSYLITNAAIFYKRDAFRAALNFNNLFDIDYFESAFNRLRVHPGTPFTVQGTISWEF
jgi:iron complex outermembrane recepter protein